MSDQRMLETGKKTARRRLGEFVRYRVLNPSRYALDLMRARAKSVLGGADVRTIALVSDGLAYCSEEQMYPFRLYRKTLRDVHGVVAREIRLNDAAGSHFRSLKRFDFVGLKMTYRTQRDDAIRTVSKIKSIADKTKIVYLDGDDDVCVQWPEILKDVELYVKKHIFADPDHYMKSYIGKSNLHDYTVREFGHKISPLDYGNEGNVTFVIDKTGPVLENDLSKIQPGWNVALDSKIVDLYESVRGQSISHDREFDLAFRGSVKPETVTYYLRKDVEDRLRPLEAHYKLLIGSRRVSQEEYYKELRNSKICVSPYGFGEICWRDFEAVLCGTLLIKPNMSHVKTAPDIFLANETYVPVKWDFSDLESVCAYFLEHEDERRRIVDNAYKTLSTYYETAAVVRTIDRLFV